MRTAHDDAVGRVAVRRGRATAAEVAAVVAALDAAGRDHHQTRVPPPSAPGWLRAARAEGVGDRRSGCPGDLPTTRW